ncbi:hypothetical protein ACP70R_047284 [Stipagrostis hirtigluma subsp. patula]
MQQEVHANMASKILAVFCVLIASLLFIAQAVIAARGLAQTSDASKRKEGGLTRSMDSYGGQWSSPGYGKPPH